MKSAIYITRAAFNRIAAIVKASDLEVSMLGEVEVVNKNIVITEIHIPKQTRQPAFTKIVHDGIIELIEQGIDPSKIKCWIHSHVNMGVSPSGQDVSQAEELMRDSEWFMRGIFNKKGEYTLSLHWNNLIVDCELKIVDDNNEDIEALKAEIESKTIVEHTTVWTGGKKNYDKISRTWHTDEDDEIDRLIKKHDDRLAKKKTYQQFREDFNINATEDEISKAWIAYISDGYMR